MPRRGSKTWIVIVFPALVCCTVVGAPKREPECIGVLEPEGWAEEEVAGSAQIMQNLRASHWMTLQTAGNLTLHELARAWSNKVHVAVMFAPDVSVQYTSQRVRTNSWSTNDLDTFEGILREHGLRCSVEQGVVIVRRDVAPSADRRLLRIYMVNELANEAYRTQRFLPIIMQKSQQEIYCEIVCVLRTSPAICPSATCKIVRAQLDEFLPWVVKVVGTECAHEAVRSTLARIWGNNARLPRLVQIRE